MTKKITLVMLLIAAFTCMNMGAEPVKIKGVFNHARYNDGEEWHSEYVGWNSAIGKAIFIVDNGIYGMTVDGMTLTQPEKDPAVEKSDIMPGGVMDDAKALWATNFNLMYGNSGAGVQNGLLVTITSRTGEDVEDSERFAVRKWDAVTGDLLNSAYDYYPASANLESAGMCMNPKDGKMYGLFYLTGVDLPAAITDDPDYEPEIDEETGETFSSDAGYAICTIDLETMTVTPVTPGLYYSNFVTFAINSEVRAFAMTSGGTAGFEGEDGKMYNMDGELTGARLCEFDLTTGLMKTEAIEAVDPDTGETYTTYESIYPASGFCSQYKRQSACFSMKDPNKMYWNGFVNSGKGYNDSGSWANLPDKEWRTNGKYDTALYEVDVTTGETTRIAKFDNRYTFCTMWVEEENNEPDFDINQDGFVNTGDVSALYEAILDSNSVYFNRCDLNADGQVNTGDVSTLYNYIINN